MSERRRRLRESYNSLAGGLGVLSRPVQATHSSYTRPPCPLFAGSLSPCPEFEVSTLPVTRVRDGVNSLHATACTRQTYGCKFSYFIRRVLG